MKIMLKRLVLPVLVLFSLANAIAADKSMCAVNANAVHYAGVVEDTCKINSGTKDKLAKMLVDAGCLNILTSAELESADKETYKGLSERVNAIGLDKFCMESKAQYFGMYEDIKGRYAEKAGNSSIPQVETLQSSPKTEVETKVEATQPQQVAPQSQPTPQVQAPITSSIGTIAVIYRTLQIVLVLSLLYFLLVGLFNPAYAFKKLTFIKNPTRLTAGGFAFVFFILIAVVQSVPAFKTIVDSDAKEKAEEKIKSDAAEAEALKAKTELRASSPISATVTDADVSMLAKTKAAFFRKDGWWYGIEGNGIFNTCQDLISNSKNTLLLQNFSQNTANFKLRVGRKSNFFSADNIEETERLHLVEKLEQTFTRQAETQFNNNIISQFIIREADVYVILMKFRYELSNDSLVETGSSCYKCSAKYAAEDREYTKNAGLGTLKWCSGDVK